MVFHCSRLGCWLRSVLPSVLYGLWGWLPAKASIIGAAFLLALTAGKLIIAAMSP